METEVDLARAALQWIPRRIARRGATTVANWLVAVLGDAGLTTYLRLVDAAIPTSGYSWLERVRVATLCLPDAGSAQIELNLGYGDVEYFTGRNDDLHFAARCGLQSWEWYSRFTFGILSQRAELVVDVGAYTGIYSLLAATANPKARILSVEPNPAVCAHLKKTVLANHLQDRVTICEVALGERSGTAALRKSGQNASTSMIGLQGDGDIAASVRVETLDELLAGRRPALMKIDVEGGEVAAFLGGESTLTRFHPVILSEARDQEELKAQQEVLTAFGYTEPIRVGGMQHDDDARNFYWTPPRERRQILALIEASSQLRKPAHQM